MNEKRLYDNCIFRTHHHNTHKNKMKYDDLRVHKMTRNLETGAIE